METIEPIPIQHGTVRLRPEVAADAAFLCALHASVKGTELAALQVGDPIRQQLLDMRASCINPKTPDFLPPYGGIRRGGCKIGR